MTARQKRVATMVAAVAISACGGRNASEPPPTRAPAVTPAPSDAWRPPSDGHLRPAQVERYVQVLDRLRTARAPQRPTPESAPSLGESMESTPDVGIGRAVFGSAEEYLWVKERILEAEGAQLAAKLSQDELQLLSRTLADLKARREKAADEGSRKLLSEQIANFEAEAERTTRESKEREPEAVRANARVLEPFRARLSALEEEVRRVAPAAAGLVARTRTPIPRP